MLRLRNVSAAAAFFAPFAVLLALWAVLVPYFDVNPRIFPHLSSVIQAGWESVGDGSLFTHIGASLLRVVVGTVLALLASIPLGIAMGVSPFVSAFLTPLFRFFSVLAGIAWIPIATLWFGYGFGAITFVIFNAVFFIVTYNTLLGVSTIPRQAKPRPVRMPVTIFGSAPGSSTSVSIAHLPAPSDAAALRTGIGMVETPSSVL